MKLPKDFYPISEICEELQITKNDLLYYALNLNLSLYVHLKYLSEDSKKGYIRLPKEALEQLLHNETIPLKYIKFNQDEINFEMIHDQIPIFTKDNLYIPESTLKDVIEFRAIYEVNFKYEVAKDEWTIWELAALLSEVNPKRLAHDKKGWRGFLSLKNGTTLEKANYQKNLEIIETWNFNGGVRYSHPFDMINRALTAGLKIPDKLLELICRRVVRENIRETPHLRPLYEKVKNKYPNFQAEQESSKNQYDSYPIELQIAVKAYNEFWRDENKPREKSETIQECIRELVQKSGQKLSKERIRMIDKLIRPASARTGGRKK